VLQEFGTEIPNDVTVRVHDSNADMRYVVIPMRPEGTEGLSELQLENLLTRDHLVGITVPTASADSK
jgi:nitrile hydratase